jgi:hypothetical protein
MPVVITGSVTAPVPGAWRRLSLLSRDGTLLGIDSRVMVGRLEQLGIPRHQHGFARGLQSWHQSRVPPDVALALWLLRLRQEKTGEFLRFAHTPTLESGPAIRYVQLASTLGESTETDYVLRSAAKWIETQILPDGSLPDQTVLARGESGTSARALCALSSLANPAFDQACLRLRNYLERTIRVESPGSAWACTAEDDHVVTGATSLALYALLQVAPTSTVIPDALAFLLSSQNPGGGWSEVPGYEDTYHNTFNAIRAIMAARDKGLLAADAAENALGRAERWFTRAVKTQAPESVIDTSYALRLASMFASQLRTADRLCELLLRRRGSILSWKADLYAVTEIFALALIEYSRALDNHPHIGPSLWAQRWELPTFPPPFLRGEAHVYELLYSTLRRQWWLHIVDWAVRFEVLETFAGLSLGLITALGVIDDRLVGAARLDRLDARHLITATVIVGMCSAWCVFRVMGAGDLRSVLFASCGAGVLGLGATYCLGDRIRPPEIPVILLYIFIIDIVAFTADRSGLLSTLLPE